jgi:DNA (cytosine-5)-methyltransferase 1
VPAPRGGSFDVARSLRGEGFDASEDGTGRGVPLVAMHETGQGFWRQDEIAGTIRAEGENRPSRPSNVIFPGSSVRRLTPVECERLQGFPDGYTGIPKMADGPRYKMLGNSMAVPVMHWIGKRIAMVDAILASEAP